MNPTVLRRHRILFMAAALAAALPAGPQPPAPRVEKQRDFQRKLHKLKTAKARL